MRALLLAAALTLVPCHAIAQSTQTPAVLAQQRVDAALRVLTMVTTQYATGTATIDDVGAWASRWFQAKRDTGISGAALVAAAQQWVDKLRAVEQVAAARVRASMAMSIESDKAGYYRLEAEIALAKLKTP